MTYRQTSSHTCDQCGTVRTYAERGYGWEEDEEREPKTDAEREVETWVSISGVFGGFTKHRSLDFCTEACMKAFVAALSLAEVPS